MNNFNILDVIPKGRSNAIGRGMLQSLTGFADRETRHMIEKAREEVPIINNGGGYYIPDSRDLDEAKSYYRSETAKARTILKNLNSLRKFIESNEQEEMK